MHPFIRSDLKKAIDRLLGLTYHSREPLFLKAEILAKDFVDITDGLHMKDDYDPTIVGGYRIEREDYLRKIDKFVISYKDVHVARANHAGELDILINMDAAFLHLIKLFIDCTKHVLLRRLLTIGKKDITYDDFYSEFDKNIKLMFEYLTDNLNKLNITGLSFDNDTLFSMSGFVTDFQYTKDATDDELLNFFEHIVLVLKPHFNKFSRLGISNRGIERYEELSLLRKDYSSYKLNPSISSRIKIATSIRNFFPVCFKIIQDKTIRHIFRRYKATYYQGIAFKWRRVYDDPLSIFEHCLLLAESSFGFYDSVIDKCYQYLNP